MKKLFLITLGLVWGLNMPLAVAGLEALKTEAGGLHSAPAPSKAQLPNCPDLVPVEAAEAMEAKKLGVETVKPQAIGSELEKVNTPLVPAKKKLDPATALAANGKSLFNAHCAGCHGPDGANPVGKWQSGIMGMDVSATLSAMDSIKSTPNATGGRLIMQNLFKPMSPQALKTLADYISTL